MSGKNLDWMVPVRSTCCFRQAEKRVASARGRVNLMGSERADHPAAHTQPLGESRRRAFCGSRLRPPVQSRAQQRPLSTPQRPQGRQGRGCRGSAMSKGFIPPHGGYKNLLSYQKAESVYDATVYFCDRFIGKRSRTHDQMVQAARSGKQNIVEGSMAAATSKGPRSS